MNGRGRKEAAGGRQIGGRERVGGGRREQDRGEKERTLRHGGRYKWLWITTIFHGLTVEMVSYWVPDIDSFWHGQTMVMFLGQRLPLYVMLVYPSFIYTASAAVAHMKLKWWAEPFAIGVSVVLLDIPFDILGIKFLWWTWHDTDPNVYDRHYWVPWTSYYFHATFACGFTFAFHGIRKLISSEKDKFTSAGFFRELITSVLTGLLGMPLGVIQFLPLYHPLHDSNNIHTEVCVCLFFAVYVMIIWTGDRQKAKELAMQSSTNSSPRKNRFLNELVLGVLLHYSFYVYLVFTTKPENIVSYGLHEPVGPCHEKVPITTAFGHVLEKNKYLCLNNYDEAIFDFHCIDKKNLPSPTQEWYTVCGTKYPNHTEYIIIICGFCAFGLYYYLQLLMFSYALPRPRTVKPKQS
ncbi:hypothetical protein FSP39_021965 [Pinctada imbricata]|uniref:DUF7802 domain-containing protein n=1 Tax=Pinctada imbricata TaxID=66713 RepID=A0AA88XTZ9_PINIB|nr:hypothetical protein FSP39_021965 [Pinctada imbricata]